MDKYSKGDMRFMGVICAALGFAIGVVFAILIGA